MAKRSDGKMRLFKPFREDAARRVEKSNWLPKLPVEVLKQLFCQRAPAI
ncbi:hypothetical protein MES5069_270149 [Mesorhizobium escarrei]|uniref:Uncharacterized protein n=1 Tax=Mesorhizobium escarrei TaxID=666018 RepID=A0ABM9DW31_9HYPH|nr:hypothetical protein MES5069_270149 [Mesorhizobium escarrei]